MSIWFPGHPLIARRALPERAGVVLAENHPFQSGAQATDFEQFGPPKAIVL